jgi:hypothetical protein
VNSIYTNGIGENQFEYFIQVQNRSAERRTVTLTFSACARRHPVQPHAAQHPAERLPAGDDPASAAAPRRTT